MLIKETIHKFRNFLGQPYGPVLIIDEKDLVHDLYGKAWLPLSHMDTNFVSFVRALHTNFKCAGDPEHKVPPLSYFTQKVEQVEDMLMNKGKEAGDVHPRKCKECSISTTVVCICCFLPILRGAVP